MQQQIIEHFESFLSKFKWDAWRAFSYGRKNEQN